MTTILLVRHGESEANLTNVFAGSRLNAQLNEKGKAQARICAEYATKNYKIDRVYSSPLDRAYNTAQACADLIGVEVVKCYGLREIDGGDWEGMTLREIKDKYAQEYDDWYVGLRHSGCVGGEGVWEMAERFLETLNAIAEENDGLTLFVATHYTPVRTMQSYAGTGSFEHIKVYEHVPNASITELFYDEGKWSLGKYSINSYLGDLSRDPLAGDVLAAKSK